MTQKTVGTVAYPVSTRCFKKTDLLWHTIKAGGLDKISSSTKFLNKIRSGGPTRNMMESCGILTTIELT